jgi:hypothetical protein
MRKKQENIFSICNCSEPNKISKNRYKMLAFLELFLKFYLADTPTSKMHSILEVGSEQLQVYLVLEEM